MSIRSSIGAGEQCQQGDLTSHVVSGRPTGLRRQFQQVVSFSKLVRFRSCDHRGREEEYGEAKEQAVEYQEAVGETISVWCSGSQVVQRSAHGGTVIQGLLGQASFIAVALQFRIV